MSASNLNQPNLKLNMGCGQNKLQGYINVDKYGEPDVKYDLEQFPWPWKDDSAEEIVLNHVLEHLGADLDVYFRIIQEMYRISCHGAMINISVPHPRHDDFINGPDHVRIVTPEHLELFSKRRCREWADMKAANSPLAVYLGVDFEIRSCSILLDEPWLSDFNNKKISKEDLERALKSYNNVAKQYTISMEVIKKSKI